MVEPARLLKVLEGRLRDREWVTGDSSIADIATGPWLRTLMEYYDAAKPAGWAELETVPAYLDRFLAQPAVQRGATIPAPA